MDPWMKVKHGRRRSTQLVSISCIVELPVRAAETTEDAICGRSWKDFPARPFWTDGKVRVDGGVFSSRRSTGRGTYLLNRNENVWGATKTASATLPHMPTIHGSGLSVLGLELKQSIDVGRNSGVSCVLNLTPNFPLFDSI